MISVMVVDDDKNYRYAIHKLIDWRDNGFDIVAEAIHGKHALKLLKIIPIDLIITDISMPQMNGVELIREVRKEYPHIQIIALSAYDNFEFVKEALKCGAFDYILKYDLNKIDVLKVLKEAKNRLTDHMNSNNTSITTDSSEKYSREVQRAINYIEEHYNEKVSLSEIAEYVNISSNYLCNIFKNETGKQIVKYLNVVRIEHAKVLFCNTDFKVYEIASHVGFENTTYFSTMFKKITGTTVNEYRKKLSE